jgi:hypothetical protein
MWSKRLFQTYAVNEALIILVIVVYYTTEQENRRTRGNQRIWRFTSN